MRKNLVFTPLMVMLAAGGLCAQDTSSAVLAGRVTSQNNQPLQGVRVLLESPSMLGVRQTTTDANGQFRVPMLPNGEYSVTYTLSGHITRKQTLRLIAGQTANGSIRLTSIDAQQVTVEIISDVAAVDKTETVVQTSYSIERLETISGRSLNAIAPMVAGMVAGNIDQQGNVSIRGGSNRGAKTLVNGTSVTEQSAGYNYNLGLLPDLIESIAVIQSPLNSRYGNTDGGLISMVTAKGSNTFTGTLRANISRTYWNVVDRTGYTRRDGTVATNTVNTTDQLGKNYELSLQGPIWKDYVTFAYGSKLAPTSYYSQNFSNRYTNLGNNQWGAYYDRVGTYYKAPNGDVIRRDEQFVHSDNALGIAGSFPASDWYEFNQYTLYIQINPSHQLEYNYLQNDVTKMFGQDAVWYAGIDELENNNYSKEGERRINWSLSYKGIIGQSGVLEARYAKAFYRWSFGNPGRNPNPINTYSINSLIPINSSGDRGDPNNYWANGYVWPGAGSTAYLEPGYESNTYSGSTQNVSNGIKIADADAGGNTAIILNYQHFLHTTKGNHIIDLGFQGDNFRWQAKASAPGRTQFFAPGLISRRLQDNDIYNVNTGSWGGNASLYKDRYIVWDMSKATLADIDPWAVANRGVRNAPAYDKTNYNGWSHALITRVAPRVELRSGDFPGYFNTITNSYYVNDLWSINDYHSVMGGLRVDNYELTEGSISRLSYSVPTLRFEYKWDIHGDQKRLLSVSWGQFHTSLASNIFANLVPAPNDDVQTMFWSRPNPDGTNSPYLVTKDELMTISNYGLEGPSSLAASSLYDVDPSWKAPVSTEIAVGLRSNLSAGGFLKATFVYRTWENEGMGFYPGDIFVEPRRGIKTIRRILQNADGYERTYKGIELEWELPLHKRVTFGGNWTWNRLMHNNPGIVDTPSGNERSQMRFDTYWDAMTGSRDAWAPVRLINPEHFINFYFLFDLTSGKINSALTLRGSYTSGSPRLISYDMVYGFPIDFDQRYRELITSKAGGGVSGTTGSGGFFWNVVQPYAYHGTSADSWGLNLRYTISMPLVRKISWLSTIDVINPFNHRGLNWGVPGFNSSQTLPFELPPTYAQPILPYGGNGNNLSSYVPRASGDLLNLYTGRQNPRSISFQTGLRF